MTLMMKRLMDEFAECADISREVDDFEAMYVYESAVSFANNCHGKSTVETLDSVESSIQYVLENTEQSANERQAFEHCLKIVVGLRDKI